MTNEYKELANICLKSVLLEIAIKNRIDFFELLRSTSVEEYNRSCPLCQISETTYNIFKNISKEINNG